MNASASPLPGAAEEAIRQWALRQAGSPYVYGATGGLCTPAMRRDKARQYPQQEGNITQYCPVLRMDQPRCQGCRYAGKAAYDCAQLVRRALEVAGIRPPSGANSQWRAPIWHSKGELAPAAASTLCVVFRSNGAAQNPMQHVGLSLGDGRVVDARSHRVGVVVQNIADYPWTHYALPAALRPLDDRVLRPGDAGEAVRALQGLLISSGHPLPRHGADGKFGQETLKALQAFQQRLGLAPQPFADSATLLRLRQAPPAQQAPPPLTLEQRVAALEQQMARWHKERAS